VKGNLTVASKYISLRMKDSDGKVVLDTRLDQEGKQPVMKWMPVSVGLDRPVTGRIPTIEFCLDMTIEDIPWDQRLNIWVDNLRFGG
jgi:hypothetical protein